MSRESTAASIDPRLDEADRFVHAATVAYATGQPPPLVPRDDQWVGRAADAGVLPAVCSLLRDAGLPLPPAAQQHRVMSVAVEMASMNDFAIFSDLMDGLEVPWALLKGPVLSRMVYRTPHARGFSDLDVLVPPEQLETVIRSLVDRGARLVETDWAEALRIRSAEIGLILPGGTYLDLHWHLVNFGEVRDGYPGLRTDDLLRRRAPRVLGGHSAMTLSDVDLVLHVALHACLSGADKLRWLLDAQQCLLWLEADPSVLAVRAGQVGLEAPARGILYRTYRHVDSGIGRWLPLLCRTTWSRGLELVDSRCPPSAPSLERRSGRVWFSSTRSTTRASAVAIAAAGQAYLRSRRHGWPEPRRVEARLSDPGFSTWIEMARNDARRQA